MYALYKSTFYLLTESLEVADDLLRLINTDNALLLVLICGLKALLFLPHFHITGIVMMCFISEEGDIIR